MKTRLLDLIKNKELSGTLIVTIALFISSVFSYLLQLSLGQSLSVLEYGEFTALLSLANIFSIPINAFSTSTIKLSSELKSEDRLDTLTHLFIKLTLLLFIFGFAVSFLLVLFRDYFSNYLNIEDRFLMVLFSINLALSFIVLVPTAYLQGLLRFKAFSFLAVGSGILRLALPLIFVTLGFGVGGVFVGLTIGAVLVFLCGVVLLKKNFSSFKKESLNLHYRRIINIAFSAFLMSIGMTLLNNIDIVLVKHYFDGTEAGLYAAVVTVGKVLLFGCNSVAVVMFPQISALYIKKGNYISKFKSFLFIQLCVVFLGVSVFYVFPEFVIKILFPKFLSSAIYLPEFSIFMGLYVLCNFMITFFLAIDKNKVFLFQIPAIVLQFILITFFHTSLREIIHVNVCVCSLLLILIMLYYRGYVRVGHSTSL